MATAILDVVRATGARRSAEVARPVTKIVGKFQTTIPVEIREIYGLREGDLIEWIFDSAAGELRLAPKRAQLITPLVREKMESVRARRAQAREQAAVAEA